VGDLLSYNKEQQVPRAANPSPNFCKHNRGGARNDSFLTYS